MDNSEQNGMAYIMVNAKQLVNNVPSLVPYVYSSDEEKEQTSDHSNQCSKHHVKSNVESLSESPRSDSSGMSEESYYHPNFDDSMFYASADESDSPKNNRKYTEDDSDEDYVPGSPEFRIKLSLPRCEYSRMLLCQVSQGGA